MTGITGNLPFGANPTWDDHTQTASAYTTSHLRKAEGDIAWLRWIGMALWFVVLYRQGFTLGLNPVWAVYAGGLAYAATVQWRLRDPRSIRTNAWIATIGDPILAASMCAVTGGIASVFFPFLYFTVLAVSFRFGVRATVAVLGLNSGLTILIYYTTRNPDVDIDALVVAIFYLGFSAALGAMLAGWARENLNLAITRSEELRAASNRGRALLHRLIGVQEEERKRFAGELHDGMGAHLFTLQQNLDDCVRHSGHDPALRKRLAALAHDSRNCTTQVRNLMNDLRPTVLDDLGLHAALSEYIAELSETAAFRITLEFDDKLRSWRSAGDAMLFRLVQEALFNVRKHAQARHVKIEFKVCDDRALLQIIDDGIGFDPGMAAPGHYGLLTMRERAEALGGKFIVDSGPAWGTRIMVPLPLDTPQ